MHQFGTSVAGQVEQLPWLGLRISLLEVSEEGRVSEVLQARGVISHDVRRPGNEEAGVTVAVSALMHAGEVAQVGGGPAGGDRAFVHAGDGRRVIRAVDEGGITDIVMMSHDVTLAYLA